MRPSFGLYWLKISAYGLSRVTHNRESFHTLRTTPSAASRKQPSSQCSSNGAGAFCWQASCCYRSRQEARGNSVGERCSTGLPKNSDKQIFVLGETSGRAPRNKVKGKMR